VVQGDASSSVTRQVEPSAVGVTDSAALSSHGRDHSPASAQEAIAVIASNLKTSLPSGTEQGRLVGSPAAARTYGILVVDDEEGVRGVLNVALRQQGFAVWLAAGGQQTLELYWQHRRAIDVVLMDVRMPGLDGPQTLAALQELTPQIRCCFMSGEVGSYAEQGLRSSSAAAVLQKPFPLAEVARVLWALAAEAEAQPSGP
jgi:CheY-like chemotaxis protein